MLSFAPFGNNTHLCLHDILKSSPSQVFVTNIKGDDLFAAYLSSFPPGTNLLYKTRTEYDCNCCKQFIRNVGNIIRLRPDGTLQTVWDEVAESEHYPFNEVAKALQAMVLAAEITDRFILDENENQFGKDVTRVMDPVSGNVTEWHHFYSGKIPKEFLSKTKGTELNRYRTAVQVMKRGLDELRLEDVDIVLSLIEANGLYRGEEHKNALLAFRQLKSTYIPLPETAKNHFLWKNAHNPAAMFRNTVIGTLIQDLSDGKDVEQAVRAFEHKVAPTNYKRTTAIVTPGMITKAMETIQALDLESALERRFARIEDISVNDVIWVDSSVKSLMKGGLADTLMAHVSANKIQSVDKEKETAEEISLDDFIHRIVPETQGMEIWFSNEQVGHMMSLTAPVHPDPKQLFKWTNDFAWSYGGNVTDSIKERVKRAGGRVENTLLRISLSWFNYDDLDIHIYQPHKAGAYREIYFGSKTGWTGGCLDVDMNAHGVKSREPVENVVWTKTIPDGEYTVAIHNFSQREMTDVGFIVEVESEGNLTHYAYNREVKNRDTVMALNLTLKNNRITKTEITDSKIVATSSNVEKWGLTTNQWVKVNTITLSPNYWGDNKVGNKHTFFVMEGAHNNEPCRGIYNEFLSSRLEVHRKVFDLIGNKTMCQPTENQLSGLGFSSTLQTSFMVKVKQGKRQRVLKVIVGKPTGVAA